VNAERPRSSSWQHAEEIISDLWAALKEVDAANHNNAEAWGNANAIMQQRLKEAEAQLTQVREACANYVAAGDVWGRDHVCTGHIGGVRREKSAEADLALMGARDAARAALAAGFSTPSGAP
jgi:hypothetical protein